MKKLLTCCFTLTSLFSVICYGQKLKTETITYNYNRLPALPVKGINNYQVTFEAAYEVKNQQALKDYEQQKQAADLKYQKDMVAYTGLIKIADDRYAKEMAEYSKKSFGTKLAEQSLLDNKKPVREIVPKPYLEHVAEPNLQSSYDYKTMADTYIHLEGYKNEPGNALKIIIVLYGYDHTQPRNMSDQQDNVRFGGSGGTGTYRSTLYHTEFSYRHPMAVKVYTPDGKEMLSVTPPQLNSYKIYKSAGTDQPSRINSDLLVKTNEEKILQDNLRFLNDLLNDRYGFSSIKRVANLYYIKDGDNGYTDLTTAFNEASSGLLMLQQDEGGGKQKLLKACELWNTALKESDPGNKKARINKDITLGIYFNLLEAYYALGDAQSGQNTLDKLNTLSLANTDRKTKLDYDVLFAELKNRQQHN